MALSWRFVRAGGFDQVAIDSADDLRNLAQLDQKLWVALACPVTGNELDARTLALVDSDGDGRIRAPELLAAIAWIDGKLTDLGAVLKGADGLALGNLADENIKTSAARILEGRDKAGADVITVEDTSGARALLDAMPFNGDGVVPPASAEDEAVKQAMQDALDTVGGVDGRNGEKGLSKDTVASFWGELEAYEAWWKKAEDDEDTVVPLGDQTAPAVEAFAAVKAKVDDFFTRCDLAAFDPRSQAHLAGAEAAWGAMAGRTLASGDDDIKGFPLAGIEPGRDLPLTEGINPAWKGAIDAFASKSVTPLLGEQSTLSRAQWADLKARFAAYEAWLGSKAGAAVEKLGVERIRELLASEHRAAIEALVARDEERRPEADALEDVDRAARYHRDLYTLAHNFVSFRAFYRPDQKAMFQAGTLYLDGRSCDLVLRVDDIGKHSATAPSSFAYLAYCACERKASGEKMSIVAAFTDGDSDFLAVGRNGLFYDRQGKDWDATITKVVEQPISIRQAFWAPYKRVVKFLSDQAEKFASEQDKAADADMMAKAQTGVTDLKSTSAGTAPPPGAVGAAATEQAAPSAFDIGKFAGIFAAVGLALGFIVSSATMLVTGFLALRLWQMPLAIGAVMLLISGPSMLLAAFKLSRSNLAPLLDANGWAINTRARINIPFGASLTSVAELPAGSSRDMNDPFAEKGRPWGLYIFLLVVVCLGAFLWDMGLSDWLGLTPQPVAEAPAVEAPAAE